MKLTKCSKGHFYDAEKFATCPHCSGIMKNAQEDVPTSPIGTSFNSNFGSDDYTMPVIQSSGRASGNNPAFPTQQNIGQSGSNQSPAGEEDDDKTIGFLNWNAPGVQETSDSRNVFRSTDTGLQRAQTSPVVGWLVCIEGASYGRSFNLYAGQNFIGRSKDMDICLSDSTVARNRHAIIIYEPVHRQFYAQAGGSHELFYVNNMVVLTSTLLKDRDVIAIGSAVFVFVPFCDEHYGWIEKNSDATDKK